ncbi:hypothetical protein [Polaribacter glomeratus]|uniref:Secretion system C-terminal sorting domain-containing protein n=1 Tax=Polaribacter glomeratus TaxID=102 RepID=A0A2S7WHC4_9FLAO|nr:hypothetical protein [Polaribacter glomeratus]PQJ77005.1 hypothetical protein BTO16_14205 [Polaribacter glomeratus]TXD67146.1 hypothetical protein ESX12_00710 [Polaribacter glomeratus]
MKTIKRNVLVVVFMLGTLFNYANNEKDFKTTVDAKKVKVVFKDVKKGQLLTVKDKNGVQLHSETVSIQGELIKFFDVSSLNNGLYTIELNKEYLIIIKSITVKENKVTFIEDSEEIIFKPIIRNEESLVLISKINFDKKPILITLFYEGEEIFSETLKDQEIVKRAYRLDDNLKGNYKVIVYCNAKSYINEFKI